MSSSIFISENPHLLLLWSLKFTYIKVIININLIYCLSKVMFIG